MIKVTKYKTKSGKTNGKYAVYVDTELYMVDSKKRAYLVADSLNSLIYIQGEHNDVHQSKERNLPLQFRAKSSDLQPASGNGGSSRDSGAIDNGSSITGAKTGGNTLGTESSQTKERRSSNELCRTENKITHSKLPKRLQEVFNAPYRGASELSRVATGFNNVATGFNNVATGFNNVATGFNNVATGYRIVAETAIRGAASFAGIDMGDIDPRAEKRINEPVRRLDPETIDVEVTQ